MQFRILRRAAIVGAAVLLAGAGAITALPTDAAAQTAPFINGSGRADAKLLRIGPSAGRLSMAPTIGLSLSDYLGTLGRGESRVADFAALDGSVPPEFTEHMPPVRAESTDENAGTAKEGSFLGTPPDSPVTVGAGRQTAYADDDPEGASSFALGVYGIPGVFEMAGGIAESRAAVVEGRTREAIGTTRIGTLSLGGGAVVLTGLRWEAVQRTGDGEGASATFTIDGATVAGQKLTLPEQAPLESVLGPINTALAPSGLTLDAPSKSTESGIARVGPLAVRMVDSSVGRQVLGPVLGGLQPIRDPITGALIDANAEFSTAVLLADVAVGVFSGAGRADIELGGASAFTEGKFYGNPLSGFSLGEFTPPAADDGTFDLGTTDPGTGSDGGELPVASSFETGTLPTPALATTTGAPAPAETAAAPTGAEQAAVPAASTRTIPGRRGGAAVAVGLVGLLTALAVAGADYRRLRMSRRTIVVS